MITEEQLCIYALVGCRTYIEKEEKLLNDYKKLESKLFVELTQGLIDDTKKDYHEILNKLEKLENETT